MWDVLIITPFTNVLLFIYNVTGQNFGIAIILFTILIRLVTHPLTVQQMKGTSGMSKLQTDPRMKEIQEKYKDDKEKLAQEQMKLYKELGVNPLAGCLPLLIQFPIIIGLYQTITQAMANTPLDMLRLVRSIWPQIGDVNTIIPLNSTFLWMNLGQPERLMIPVLNFGIPVLAIIVVITTYMQSKVLTPPTANPNDQTAQMTNQMNMIMPLMMGWLALTYASGLALYFVISNVVGIIQYAIMGKANWKNLLPTLPSLKPIEKPANKKSSEKKSAAQKPDPQGKQPNRGKNESRKDNTGNHRADSR